MYCLNGASMTSREEVYAEIRRALPVPPYFGDNLDALNDILGDMEGEICLCDACKMLNALGGYGCRLLAVFYQAAERNSGLRFRACGG